MSFTVAIDGPAAAGKGTIARAIAEHFGLAHLDTGLIYRAVAKQALATGRALSDAALTSLAEDLTAKDLADEHALRTSEIAQMASKIAAVPEVREALVAFQRAFAVQDGGAVLDGRDIGTVICPDADVKLFVDANDDVRATRRMVELRERGEPVDFDTVLDAVKTRDQRDRGRALAPLIPAEDAHLIDTSELSIEEAVARSIQFVEAAR
ncbi:MAG: (d)CMP kinase [Pseudomonadota bacterium]